MTLKQKLVNREGVDAIDRDLLAIIQEGLPLVSHPFAEIGRQLSLSEEEVIVRITALREQGVIKRMGVVVRHRQLGYRANAMVVWNVPDHRVDELGKRFADSHLVTLCYQRPRRGPEWPYNLFCMIHGKDRTAVMDIVERLAESTHAELLPRQVLFSKRCFKQRGANYREQPGAHHGQS